MEEDATLDVVKRLWARNGFIRCEVEPGYELVGEYLCADLGALDGIDYTSARRAVERGLAGESADYNGEAFSLDVDGAQTTLELVASQVDITFPTKVMERALERYAEFRRTVDVRNS